MNPAENPLVSVIIPTYNSSQTIIRAVESVLRQTYAHVEIIVIDDGSTDTTKLVLDPYIQAGTIMYIYQKNAGCGVARNTGINQVQGEYIALLDADDYWHDEKLARQIEIFNKHSDVIVCYTESYVRDPFSELIWETKRDTVNRPRSGSVVRFLPFHNIITLSSAMIRKDVLLSVGGFETRYDLMMVADLDVWLKLAPLGKFFAIPTPLTFYQTRFGITQKQILENHRQIRDVFANRITTARFSAKMWYCLGWIRSSVLYYASSMKIIHTIKKIGIRGVTRELFRRLYLRIDFLVYPILIYRLKKLTSNTTDNLCDFSYRNSVKLLVPGQVESEITSFLEIARNIKPKNILEIGTAHGGNLFLLTRIGEPNGKVLSIDLPNGDYGGGYFSRKQAIYNKFATRGQKMFLIRDDSHVSATLEKVREIIQEEKIDLLFIDADHSYAGVKSDFEMYSPLVRPGGIIAFHDIANDPDATYGVNKFWNEIKNQYRHRELIDDPHRIGYGIGIIFL